MKWTGKFIIHDDSSLARAVVRGESIGDALKNLDDMLGYLHPGNYTIISVIREYAGK
jgi:hypothetical protein